MYNPDHFALTDPAKIAAVIAQYNFGLLVTTKRNDGGEGSTPTATHLPFLFDAAHGPQGTLIAHMARANPQWRCFDLMAANGQEALTVFQGPHAYISPTMYGPGPAVPTWNYVAIHAYGVPRIIEDAGAVRAEMVRLVAAQEAAQPEPWRLESLDEKFAAAQLRGIVAFEIPITRCEAKAKLNQNRTPEQRRGVIEALASGGDPLGQIVADWMRDL